MCHKVVDIKRIISRICIIPFLCFLSEGGVGGRKQGGGARARGGVGRGVGAITFIYDILYQPNTHWFEFSTRYSLSSYSLEDIIKIFHRAT